MAAVAEEVMEIFAAKGQSAYFGECVSQLEHALQASQFARQANATPALIVAALLHDIGHLLADMPENIADFGIDAKHEDIGRKWLEARFSKAVAEPVFLHVSAKRYLCTTKAGYLETLSPASTQSLALQGGLMRDDELRSFEANRYYREALALRVWDDQAKIPNLATPPLAEYVALLDEVAADRADST